MSLWLIAYVVIVVAVALGSWHIGYNDGYRWARILNDYDRPEEDE